MAMALAVLVLVLVMVMVARDVSRRMVAVETHQTRR